MKNKLFALWIFAVFIFLSSCKSLSSPASKHVPSNDNAAQNPIVRDILIELNRVRRNPKKYAEEEIKPRLKYFDPPWARRRPPRPWAWRPAAALRPTTEAFHREAPRWSEPEFPGRPRSGGGRAVRPANAREHKQYPDSETDFRGVRKYDSRPGSVPGWNDGSCRGPPCGRRTFPPAGRCAGPHPGRNRWPAWGRRSETGADPGTAWKKWHIAGRPCPEIRR